MNEPRPPITILGTGALAMRFGATLARAGHAVTLAGTWAEGLAAMGGRGIEVVEGGSHDATAYGPLPPTPSPNSGGGGGWFAGVETIDLSANKVPQSSPPQPVILPLPQNWGRGSGGGGRRPSGIESRMPSAEADLSPSRYLLVVVKSHQTPRLAPVAAHLAAPDGLIVTLQNGLGNAECLAAAAGPDRVAVGVTTLGAAVAGPGRVRFGGDGTVTIGRSAATAARVDALVDILVAAGIDAAATDDIAPTVWRKLAVNCAINPLTAYLGVPNGRLLDDPRTIALLHAAAAEVAAVAAALGIPLDADVAALAEAVAARTADNRSSMLQDTDRGAPTEIDAINGAVVRAGKAVGVETPVNAALWQAIVSLTADDAASPRPRDVGLLIEGAARCP